VTHLFVRIAWVALVVVGLVGIIYAVASFFTSREIIEEQHRE
jgi:phage shock protein PspC (stress-responsive transcriptional regulator)